MELELDKGGKANPNSENLNVNNIHNLVNKQPQVIAVETKASHFKASSHNMMLAAAPRVSVHNS